MNRSDNLQEIMARRELRAIVLTSGEYVGTFSGTYLITQTIVPDRLAYLVAVADGPMAMIVCDIEEALVRRESHVDDVRAYVEFVDDPTAMLGDVLDAFGLTAGRIGVDARRLSSEAAQALRARLPDVELVSVDDDVEAAQMIKTPEEATALQNAGRLTQEAIEQAVAASSLGATEVQLTSHIASAMTARGGTLLFLVFGSGQGSLVNHLEASDRVMEPGEIWRVDVGARHAGGILSDLGRTGVIGEPSADQSATLKAVRACQAAGVDLIEPGRPVCEVYDACARAFHREGLPWSMPHVGHGLGIGLHEQPRLQPRSDLALAEGMIVNVEVVALMNGRGEGYFTEDLVQVTADGHRLLTTPQEELLVLR